MSMRKKWSFEEKINILNEAEIKGVAPTYRKYNLSGVRLYKDD